MRWILKQGNILDEPADVLICSANVNLLLSGGVGADLLARFGGAMQASLLQMVAGRTPRCVQRGDVVPYVDATLPYLAVLHAVAVDGWYDSSPAVITEVVRKGLTLAAGYAARRVALTALATGFGRLSFAEFAQGLNPLLSDDFSPIEETVICLLQDFEVAELSRYLPITLIPLR